MAPSYLVMCGNVCIKITLFFCDTYVLVIAASHLPGRRTIGYILAYKLCLMLVIYCSSFSIKDETDIAMCKSLEA